MTKLVSYTLRRLLRSPQPHIFSAGGPPTAFAAVHEQRQFSTATANDSRGKWLTLPPFFPTVDGSAVGKKLSSGEESGHAAADGKTTAFKWILRCYPDLPRNLVQKLFRLRQVRRELAGIEISTNNGDQARTSKLKRVAAKESLNIGDRIYLPITVRESPMKIESCCCSEEEQNFVRDLVLYKDSAIMVVNKPPGMPVQGGIGIKTSLDELATACLIFDRSEPPRLVHRLDRDSSGLLVLAREQTSARILHSIFREKTSGASVYGVESNKRILKRKYWALVIGSPRRQKGLISAPLRKVIVDDGKSDRITVHNNNELISSQHAITEYRVIESSSHGYTWLELCPLTGRKHQLRVHCAEVLGTPILGDYKYGWQAHKMRKQLPLSDTIDEPGEKIARASQFGLDLEGGDITSKQPYLHLHSKEIILPDISKLLENLQVSSNYNLSELKSLRFNAPLPAHMQISWDILKG